MRDVSAHIRAILIATVASAMLLTIAGPQVSLAGTPSGLGRFMNAIGHVESGGRYTARNKISGAFGKYQIMPSNWPSWARIYLGDSKAKPTPINQERVARGKFTTLYRSLGSWRRVAYWWLTGSSTRTGWSSYATHYVNKVMARYRVASPKIPTGAGAGGGSGGGAVRHRYSEGSSHVAYGGTWKSARFRGYVGHKVKYATAAGATATVTFTGRRITWVGPLGPTRGKARISIDGTHVRTVDLHRRGFDPRAALYTKTWTSKGAHTLTIEVVGSGKHPMVAIDEFLVRE